MLKSPITETLLQLPSNSDVVLVRPAHMRAADLRYCSRGARDFAERNKLDWNTFVFHGIPDYILIATGDAMALAVVEEARREWAAKVMIQP